MIGKVAGKPDMLVQKPWFPVKILPTNRSTEDRFEAPQDPTVWRGQKVFRRFVQGLHLEKRMEFAEGDIGLPGGIQILEPANLYPTYEDSIHRSLAKNRFWHFFWMGLREGVCCSCWKCKNCAAIPGGSLGLPHPTCTLQEPPGNS